MRFIDLLKLIILIGVVFTIEFNLFNLTFNYLINLDLLKIF
jgi:hypothetical protein